MTIDKLRFLVENSGKLSTVKIGKELGVDHTTVIYYQKKLREVGHDIPTFHQSEARNLIAQLKSERSANQTQSGE